MSSEIFLPSIITPGAVAERLAIGKENWGLTA